MAKKITAVITGDKELNKKLHKLTSKQQKEAFRKSARPAIKPVQAQAKAYAKDTEEGDGTLSKSYKVRGLPRSRTEIGVRVTSARDAVSFIELGHMAGDTKVEGRKDLKGAADVKGKEVLRDYTNRMKKNIMETAKK